MPKIIHFNPSNTSSVYTPCGGVVIEPHNSTKDPTKVTCRSCKNTVVYKTTSRQNSSQSSLTISIIPSNQQETTSLDELVDDLTWFDFLQEVKQLKDGYLLWDSENREFLKVEVRVFPCTIEGIEK